MATYKFLTEEEIEALLNLQRINLKSNLSEPERSEQGFLIVKHDREMLLRLISEVPSVVAVEENKMAGYCLSMTVSMRHQIPVLVPMFNLFDTLTVNGRALKNERYVVVGQVCVAEDYRGKGIFKGLYNHFRALHQGKYTIAVTEISDRNTRSMTAHSKLGFKFLTQYTAPDGEVWNIVYWDWS